MSEETRPLPPLEALETELDDALREAAAWGAMLDGVGEADVDGLVEALRDLVRLAARRGYALGVQEGARRHAGP